uniref:Uncharacterized protein n=1 Tax=Anguilla anguilla TaxID=7936 RepID=A0A0E9SQE5_ANGAN
MFTKPGALKNIASCVSYFIDEPY